MDGIELILKRIHIPIVIWKKDPNEKKFKCYLQNGFLGDVKKGMEFEDYLLGKENGYKYKDFVERGRLTKIHLPDHEIILEFIDENIFYEIHYPKYNLHLLKTISHRIRVPLTNIIGIISIMEDMPHNSDIRGQIDIIKQSSINIISVINDIIDIMNFEYGHMVLDKQKVDIYELLRACKNIVYNDAVEKKINLNFSITENFPEIVLTDEKRLEQLIVTLISNAIKNTENSTIFVSLDLLTEEEMKKHKLRYKGPSPSQANIIIKIKDSGKGYTEDEIGELKKIFNSDNREVSLDSYKYLSFGLIIVKYLIDLMEGKIWFKNYLDMGNIFYCYLPLETVESRKIE